jgi:glycosyltransferase involved in cell wall biosynthesis
MPKVSVIMSVFNGEPYLSQAIESILGQTFDDFEFIIVDDGSTDSSPMILETFAKKDVRIRLLRNDSNSGLIASLNKAFQAAKGKYIARQDADDISLRERLALQVWFLDRHRDVGVVGTWITNVNEDDKRTAWKTPTTDSLIQWSLIFCTSIAHPTVMMRRCLLDEGVTFRPEMTHAEDYDLWSRLSERTRFANLPHCLYLRQCHKERVSVRHADKQKEVGRAIMLANIEKLLGTTFDYRLVHQLDKAYRGHSLKNGQELEEILHLVVRLYETFVASKKLNTRQALDIGHDAAHFLTHLGLKHLVRYPKNSIRLLRKATRLNRGIPLKSYVGVALGWRRAFSVGED